MTALTTPVGTDALADLARSSVSLITSLQHPSGAYPASPTFSAYQGYSWFRDGAFIADGVSSAGAVNSASRFFDWCQRMLVERRSRITEIVEAAAAGRPLPDEHMLPTRFTMEGAEGDDDWWDFQTDGYGTWVWAAVAHADRHGLDVARWRDGIALSVDYLAATWSRPCYDWWEEHREQVHVSTLLCIVAGLEAAVRSAAVEGDRADAARGAAAAARDLVARRGVHDGHLTKWLGSTDVDGSLSAAIAPLGVIDATSPLGRASIRAVDDALDVGGGVHRFSFDTFYGGGQWPLLSCMLGLAYAAAGDRPAALARLEWAARTVTPEGYLPEQVSDHLLAPERRAEWVERWGDVATPLLWSHAMFVRLAIELDIITPHVPEEGA
ncbi:glycoside hydrolase family 15 protein [Microcella alkaliphila]|uniref:Glucan 1,4-alpha-glucosidase n=1 Tax=Microcella alkaliphila TaxID=279828 RepID=A0A0U5BRI6_9MICO|nr:glycoside hydrolase family 15 protein [Microcella alkaliphila]BAU32918.1 glucan 1,4-alpha-glucosidase [Microcella alkaliphila]